MGNQTNETDYSYSDGLSFEISTDGMSSWLDMGVMENGASFSPTFDKSDLEAGNAEDPDPLAKNQTITMSPSALWTWKSANIAAISGGLYNRTAVAGTETTDDQVVASGDWSFDNAILLTGQNGDGTEPTVNSVTGSTDGAGSADDYDTALINGGWYLIPRDGTNFTTESQSLAINVTYTPAAMYEITTGETTTVLEPFAARFTHWTNDALTEYDWRMTIYRVTPNSVTMEKLGAKSDNDLDSWTIELEGEVDTSRTSGDQLFKMEMEA